MQSLHEIRVDLVRLLGATENIGSTIEVSTDEHWHRFCQFLISIEELQAKLQALPVESGPLPPPTSKPPAPFSPEDVAGFDRRIDVLRRKRDGINAMGVAATRAKAIEAFDPVEDDEHFRALKSAGSPSDGTRRSRCPGRHNPPRGMSSQPIGSGVGCADVRPLQREEVRTEGKGKEVVGGQVDEVAEEIASMARRLKESSMAINESLRSQTKVLEDTGDAAALNVDEVKRENTRVAHRLRKKRAAAFASWCMMLTVLISFFATYALIILPFEKRRGPFVKSMAFVDAAEQPPTTTLQQQQHGAMEAADEERRLQANKAHSERARKEKEKQATLSAGLRHVAEENERDREGQTGKKVENERVRAAIARDASESGGSEDDVKASNFDNTTEGSPSIEGEQRAQQQPKTEVATAAKGATLIPDEASDGLDRQGDGEGGDGDGLTAAQEYRRQAQEAYMARSHEFRNKQAASNADLRVASEQKEAYRRRHAKRMMENSRERRQARLEIEANEPKREDTLKSEALGRQPSGGEQSDIQSEKSTDPATTTTRDPIAVATKDSGDAGADSDRPSATLGDEIADGEKSACGSECVQTGEGKGMERDSFADRVDAVRQNLKETMDKMSTRSKDEL